MRDKTIRTIGWVLFGCVSAFSIALFYFGVYRYLLVGDSTSFALENTRHILQKHSDATMIVLGDSTAAQDFRPNFYNRNAAGEKTVNAGVPGTGLFTYDKLASLAKDKLPNANKILLILGPDQFNRSGGKRILSDLEYNKTALTLQDIYRVWNYTNSAKDFTKGAVSLLIRPVLFGKDLHDQLLHPLRRLRSLKGTYSWLNRPISVEEPLWEDDRGMNACGIGDLDRLPDTINERRRDHNDEEVKKLEWIEYSYRPRKAEKEPDPHFIKQLITLLSGFSRQYEKIYVVNAPIYSGFEKAYSRDYLQKIETITRGVSGAIPHVEYIAPNSAFNDDCSNFMDVVHLNKYGAERFTDYLIKEINKRDVKPLILTKYGPGEIKAGLDFNMQSNGNSAIWTETNNGTQSTVLVLNGVELQSVVARNGSAVTAYVPRKLYRKAGQYPLYLFDKKTQARSNMIEFTVK